MLHLHEDFEGGLKKNEIFFYKFYDYEERNTHDVVTLCIKYHFAVCLHTIWTGFKY